MRDRDHLVGVSTAERKPGNMSRVVAVEAPDGRDGFAADETSGSALRVVTQSPMDALRMGMASPLRSLLGLLKPPPLPGSSLHGCEEESPRASSVEMDAGSEMSVVSRVCEARRDGQSVVMVAFDANVKEVSHAGIVWAMEHALKRGDVLVVVSVLDSVRGPLGYRVRIGDPRWMSANRKLVEEEIEQKAEAWRNFPGLDNRCAEGGVKLAVVVKAAQRSEVAICREAVRLGACHLVLDRSLRSRRREFYLHNLSCDVTRMRRSGGVDVIRPSVDIAMMMSLVQRKLTPPLEPRSPTSVIPAPLLSYGDQIDVFEISLGSPKPKRVVNSKSSPAAPPLPSPGDRSSSAYSGELLKSEEFRHCSSSAYSGELMKSGELRRLSSSAVLASGYERSSSMSLSTSGHARSSSVSAAPSVQASFTSSSNATEHDVDDDLFSIFHGSTRHTEIDTDLFHPPSTSGYESDDLFSIGNASTRRTSPAPVPLDSHHSHSQPLLRPIPDAMAVLRPNPRLSLDALATPSSSCELVISEPLREATISRVTFVVGLGEAVTLSLHQPLRPGEGLLVGSSPSALFLMHSDHHAATLSAATPGSYIAMAGKMAMKLAFLEPDQRVLAVDSLGRCRTVPVRHASTAATPLVLVEAQCEGRRHSAMLHHSECVGLCHSHGHGYRHGESGAMVSVKALQVGDRVLLRLRSAEPSHAIWSS